MQLKVILRFVISRGSSYFITSYLIYQVLFNGESIIFFLIILGILIGFNIIRLIIKQAIDYIEDNYFDGYSKLFTNIKSEELYKNLVNLKSPAISKIIHYFENHNEKGNYFIGGGTDENGKTIYTKDKNKVKKAILNNPKDYYMAVLRTKNNINQDKKEYFKKTLEEHETYRSKIEIGHMFARESRHRKAIKKYINEISNK